jgi:hypothetical protein
VPQLTVEDLTVALAILSGVAIIALISTLVIGFRLRRLRTQYKILRGNGAEADLITLVRDWSDQMRGMHRRIDEVVAAHQELETIAKFAVQKFALVRYDAFEDMGGRLSFSAALLDDHGDGMIITSINGRTETRTYAKAIKALASDHNLSEEERRALQEAMAGTGRGQAEAASAR